MEGYDGHYMSVNIDNTGDRFPHWSVQETRDFLMIRAELDPTFMETKRNKLLWDVIATKMNEKGYNRSTEQCKNKWKNLVTRYKGCQTMKLETQGMCQHFPFYNELQAIFTARMERMLWTQAEGRSNNNEDDNEESDTVREMISNSKKKKKRKVIKTGINQGSASSSEKLKILKELLEEFMKQNMEMEMLWIKAYEAREDERMVKEMEWRQTMDALENERIMLDRRWRERQEQRGMRDEVRAERRDALVTVLLNKLRREDL
ncbi:hypothetical protein CsSME_00017546 [Camellia sinensis var. sinensis]|uniref:trihelix transcription factor GT-3b-like n=1 Tax=Camellia sinensis TaxID=4442 RepID=UPI0010355882|nr:trihelix transcription factor GT-3b-like [Camellia sinensis]XP_028075980.1 trihelix transcription factor GT-3b-like [Camellia sinensis]